MSLSGTYDTANVFARILRGELPCHRVFENEAVLAFLDLFPQSTGHTLVIPKQGAARNFLDVPPGILAALYANAQIVARGLIEELRPEGLQVLHFNGAAAGQTVFHLHVHLIPRWEADPLKRHASDQADPATLAALAARIAARLAA